MILFFCGKVLNVPSGPLLLTFLKLRGLTILKLNLRHLIRQLEVNLKKSLGKFQRSTFSITFSVVKYALRKIKKKTSFSVDLVSAKRFEIAIDLRVQQFSLLFQMSIYSDLAPQQFRI